MFFLGVGASNILGKWSNSGEVEWTFWFSPCDIRGKDPILSQCLFFKKVAKKHRHETTPPRPKTNEWQAGKSTMNESMCFLLKMRIFQPVMSVFRGVVYTISWLVVQMFFIFTPEPLGNHPIWPCAYIFQMGWWTTTTYCWWVHKSCTIPTDDTVDGRNPKQPPGMYKTLYGINYQPQLVSRISSINQ